MLEDVRPVLPSYHRASYHGPTDPVLPRAVVPISLERRVASREVHTEQCEPHERSFGVALRHHTSIILS